MMRVIKYVSRALTAVAAGVALAAALPSAPAKAEDPIPILVMDVFSGPFKDIGDRYRMGVEYAVSEINANGGIDGQKIKLLSDDTELKPEVAQRKAVKYILDEQVKVIMGAAGSHVVNALAQVADKHRVILALYSGEGDYITGESFVPAVFRLGLNTSMHSKATVSGFAERPERSFYLLNQDYSFGHDAADRYKKYLDRLVPDWELAGEEFHPIATKDFAPYVQKISASGADAVLTANWGADMTNLESQAKQFKLGLPFGHYYLSDPLALREIGDAAVGSITSEVYMMTVDTPQNREFVERWHEDHKAGEHPWPAFTIGKAYNATMFLAEAIKKAGSAEYDALIEAWEGLAYDGLVGRQVMRACDHQIQSPVAVGEIVADNPYYDFPFVGPTKLTSLEDASIPKDEVNNPRCHEG